ncbi:MAG: hypothetical protein WC670_20510 [Pseudolabrys sp.]|jgi:hypothetical protein
MSGEPVDFKPRLMLSQPGIQRDGTRLNQTQYGDGRWCRFYQGLPRKMNGFQEQLRTIDGIVRGMDVESYDGYSYVHVGSQDVLQRYTIQIDANVASGLIDRTPAGFVASESNNWQFSLVYNTANNSNILLAHAAPNMINISSTVERPVYYGEVRDTAPLLPISGSDVSGGILAMWPYLLRFGNDGEVAWPVPGNLTDLVGAGSGSARPWGTKIVKGLPLRGTSGPAGLLWALDAVVRVQFVGGTEIFQFDTLTTSSALLSSNGVIEHAGVYYWATVSGWSMFNGVIRDLDNETNRQWFLDNLNWTEHQKIFAFKIPRWQEIWWCFPYGDATECTHAVIYNYVKNLWYDTELMPQGASAGVYEQIYHFPIVATTALNVDTNGRSMLQFDVGLDEVSGSPPTSKAIPSHFETCEFNLLENGQIGADGLDRRMSFAYLEPDYDQIGDLEFTINTRMNARAQRNSTGPITIPAEPTGTQQLVKRKLSGRLTSFKIESNQLGGFYQAGAPLIHWQPSDGRREGG